MGKPKIPEEKAHKIKELRRNGFSIPEIHRELKVSRVTVLRYVQGVEILSEFRQRWLDRRNASKIISEKAWLVARGRVKSYINNLSIDQLKLIGATLYWAEGANGFKKR
jgi:hypothetical protein